jgi:hypothetical protein
LIGFVFFSYLCLMRGGSVCARKGTHASSDGHPMTLHPTHVNSVVSHQLQFTGLEPQQQYSGEPAPHSTLSTTTNPEAYATPSDHCYSGSYDLLSGQVRVGGRGREIRLRVALLFPGMCLSWYYKQEFVVY